MKFRSDFREALTNMYRLDRESGEERLKPISSLSIPKVAFFFFFFFFFFFQYFMVAVEWKPVELKIICVKNVVARSFTADGDLLQPTGCVNRTSSHVTVSGLSHAVVKEAEHLRVQELVKKIESHPHREVLHADLQQNNVYNPFSKNSKAIIRGWRKWSYSSCAKLYLKYNVLTVFFIGTRIDSGEDKDRRYPLGLWTHGQGTQRSVQAWLDQTTSKSGKCMSTRCTGLYSVCSTERLKFYQTRSNAIILCDTLPAYCISKAIVMKSEDIICQKVFAYLDHRRRFPIRDIWTCDLDSDLARSSEDNIQRIELNPILNYQVFEQLLQNGVKNTLERTKFDRGTLNQEKYDNVTDPTSTERAVDGQEFTERCVLTPKHVENDQTGTGRPVTVDQKQGTQNWFRVPGFSHAVVKEAEHLRVQELVKKIENLPHREALQADLQQNNVYNPYSDESKAMIRELGNVELVELCETIPKVQCSHCLIDWNQGIVYLRLRTMLCWQRILKKVLRTKAGCTLFPRLRDKERTSSWCSIWQDRSTKNTIWPGMRGRDAVRKSTPKVNI